MSTALEEARELVKPVADRIEGLRNALDIEREHTDTLRAELDRLRAENAQCAENFRTKCMELEGALADLRGTRGRLQDSGNTIARLTDQVRVLEWARLQSFDGGAEVASEADRLRIQLVRHAAVVEAARRAVAFSCDAQTARDAGDDHLIAGFESKAGEAIGDLEDALAALDSTDQDGGCDG